MVRALIVLWAALLASVWVANSAAALVPAEFQPNYDKGYDVGYPKGYKSGFIDGKRRGRTEGWENGTNDGKTDGWNAAFQPAYDIAYDARFPLGHRDGWKEGLFDGFDQGFEFAPVIAKQVYEYYGIDTSSGVMLTMAGTDYFLGSGSGLGAFGAMVFDADYTVWRNDRTRVDYAKFYYDEGFTVGQADGFSTGSQEGYDLAYPKAYGAAYPLAYRLGVGDGTREGTRQGGTAGFDDGFDSGYGSGYDEGFYAGIDYRLFGEFSISKYSLEYTRRSDAFTRQALKTAQAPEPGSALLVGMAGVGVALNARRQRRG